MIALVTAAGSALILIAAVLALAVGVRRVQRQSFPRAAADSPITVIVSAHNEAENLPVLLAAMRKQTYPHDSIRLIIANDRSTDATAEVCNAGNPGEIALTMIEIASVPNGVSPKKHALAKAIAAADTEFLLFTDADCIPESHWVESMVCSLAEADVVIGASPVAARSPGPASRYAAYESRRTALFMMGAAGLGLPYMAVGRNWSYRKSAYQRIGGLEPLFPILGGDDDLLLQRFAASGARIRAVMKPDSSTPTQAPATWRALFRQKRRHYNAGNSYRPGILLMLGGIQLLEWVCFVSAIVGIFTSETVWKPIFIIIPIVLWGSWASALGRIPPANRRILPQRRAPVRFSAVLWEGVHLFFSTMAGLAGLVKPRSW